MSKFSVDGKVKRSWWGRNAPWSFINSPEEWHAFIIGWAEVACPWWARYRCTKAAEYTPEKEYHYYLTGRVVGFVMLVFFGIGMWKMIT